MHCITVRRASLNWMKELCKGTEQSNKACDYHERLQGSHCVFFGICKQPQYPLAITHECVCISESSPDRYLKQTTYMLLISQRRTCNYTTNQALLLSCVRDI